MSALGRVARTALAFAFVVGGGCASSSTSSNEPAPAAAPADASTSPPAAQPDAKEQLATKLATWLEGRFDSKEQAKRDRSYFEITLVMCTVDAPELGKRALYVEQAMVGKAPYRQRLYVIEPIDPTSARSRVFELVSPKAAVGLCDREARAFAATDVTTRDGCDVEMHWVDTRFVGHTPDATWDGTRFMPNPSGQRCPSDLNGAAYATSEVELRDDGLESWDRGFDEAGTQKWGAERGPYEFTRRTPHP